MPLDSIIQEISKSKFKILNFSYNLEQGKWIFWWSTSMGKIINIAVNYYYFEIVQRDGLSNELYLFYFCCWKWNMICS
jgi:hypothetical protein